MSYKNTDTTFGSVTKFFHWLIFIILLGMIPYGLSIVYFSDYIPKEYQGIVINIHKLIGLCIFTIALLWILWTLINRKPQYPADMPRWQKITARIVHYSMFIILLAMPIVGMIGSSLAGKRPHVAGFNIGYPLAENKALAETMFDIHNLLALILVLLILLHISAALYHHYVKRDNILLRMLPGSRYD